jgi:hypothetical protein
MAGASIPPHLFYQLHAADTVVPGDPSRAHGPDLRLATLAGAGEDGAWGVAVQEGGRTWVRLCRAARPGAEEGALRAEALGWLGAQGWGRMPPPEPPLPPLPL